MYYYTVYYAMWFTAQSSHLNMYMAAAKSANISSWAFTPGTPIPTAVPSHFSRRHYFVFTTSATSPHPDKKFWVDVQVGMLFPRHTSALIFLFRE